MSEAILFSTRQKGIAAAQGHVPFDLLLTGAVIVDVATLELRDADIGIIDNMIASVHPRGALSNALKTEDVSGLTLTPGFIDAHMHFESSHMLPHHYSSVVVPQGTTTVFCDPHEFANVLGVPGLRWAVEATRDLALRFIVQASSCVPAAPGLERTGADFQAAEISEILGWPEVAGLAEVMDMRAVLEGSPRMHGILEAAHRSGKMIEGHARGLSGGGLQAYGAAGIWGDHEIVSAQDALEKLRAGLVVELRGSHDYLLPDVVAAIKDLPNIPPTLTICTDDVFPDQLVERGGMRDVIQRLIRYGLPPLQAIRCATFNTAMHIRRSDLGRLAPGRRADIVGLSNLDEVKVERVWTNGVKAAEGGAFLLEQRAPTPPPRIDSMRVLHVRADDFRIRGPGASNGRATINAIKGARFTSWSERDVEIRDGFVVVPDDASLMSVIHRHGRAPATPKTALIEGWGRWRGAYASSYAHDSHNLTVFGADTAEMALAANRVVAMGGGIAVVAGGRLIAELAYPVAGLLSTKAPADVAREHARIARAAGEVCAWEPPYRVFKALEGQSLACNAGPHLTDMGLTDGLTKQLRPMFTAMLRQEA